MSSRYLTTLRKFSTSTFLRRPVLSENYKSKELWHERFTCNILSDDQDLAGTINRKIIIGEDLDNLEVDVFINVATPRTMEIEQLQESVRVLKKLRGSICANTILPSTSHAICRLFQESQRLSSLLCLLENRVRYGVFPDTFAMNLIFDEALTRESYASAAKLATLVMLQEDFGANWITDGFSLFSLAKYIEQQTDFSDWAQSNDELDPILAIQEDGTFGNTVETEKKEESKEEESKEDDEDEDDSEYIRVPFLRNPYSDNHFDLKNPRLVCGKALTDLARTLENEDTKLSSNSNLLGAVLQGKWLEAIKILDNSQKSSIDLSPVKEACKFYIDNLHDIEAPSEDERTSLLSKIKNLPEPRESLSELSELRYKDLGDAERQDIENYRSSIVEWSKLRSACKKAREDKVAREALIAEIEAKKKHLELKEQYLYFYDNYRRSRLSRIDYR